MIVCYFHEWMPDVMTEEKWCGVGKRHRMVYRSEISTSAALLLTLTIYQGIAHSWV